MKHRVFLKLDFFLNEKSYSTQRDDSDASARPPNIIFSSASCELLN